MVVHCNEGVHRAPLALTTIAVDVYAAEPKAYLKALSRQRWIWSGYERLPVQPEGRDRALCASVNWLVPAER